MGNETFYQGIIAVGITGTILAVGTFVGGEYSVRSRNREPISAEIKDVNNDGIQDIVVTNAGNKKRYLFGLKEGDNTIYLSLDQLRERNQTEFDKKYSTLEEKVDEK